MTSDAFKVPQFFYRTEGAPQRSVLRVDPTQPAPTPVDPAAGPVRSDWQPPCPLIMLEASPDGSTQGLWWMVAEDATTCTYAYGGDTA